LTTRKNALNTGKPKSNRSNTTDKNTESNDAGNTNTDNRESIGSMQDYVSGDATRSSSSHKFQKNTTGKKL
jgi:hypothetical protein